MAGTFVLQVEVTTGGVTIGLATATVLVLLPVAFVALAVLILRDRSDAPTDDRSRRLLFFSRTVVVTCLLVAGAGPYYLTTERAVTDPRVTMMVDESRSMDVFDVDADALATAIEAEGVPVERTTVGSENTSRPGDGVVASVERNGSVLLMTDGRATDGRSLEAAAEFARGLDATVSAVDLGSPTTERSVRVAGPEKTTVGVSNRFLVTVDGVEGDGPTGPANVTVTVDGETVATDTVSGTGNVEFEHAFETTGTHRVTVRIDAEDRLGANNVFHRTVRVVPPPSVLYVTGEKYPFGDLLERLYDVTVVGSVPADLSAYDAVVLQDVPADRIGDLDALRTFVADGNGLVVVGGENAFENGAYAESPFSGLLPVQPGEAVGAGVTVVVAIDVSGSTAEGMTVQKALALDVLSQLDLDDRVGVVAFDDRAYLVAQPQRLEDARPVLEDRIRRLVSGGGTSIAAGIDGAGELLGDAGGNVVLLTDGLDDSPAAESVARRLGNDGVRVITVGVGERIDERRLRAIADSSGGTYLRADETNRLRILFGDQPRPTGGPLTVVDDSHFITAGVDPTATPGRTHDVSVKRGADFLVASGTGAPAVAAWRFGLGRVVTVTSYGADGTLDGLLGAPDSLLLSRSVNWAVGDPERTATGVVSLPDTRVGDPTRAVYVGPERPAVEGARFVQTAPGRFEAPVVPDEPGFSTVLDDEFAVNYPVELAAFGVSSSVDRAVETTGGRTFGPDQAGAIAEFVTRQATVTREVRRSFGWIFLMIALVVYLVDVAARRLQLLGPGEPTE